MTILIPTSDNNESFLVDGNPISTGSLIGLFYINDQGELSCAGSSEWDADNNFSIAAWGDDSQTPETDGFDAGDAFIWLLSYPDENADSQVLTASTVVMDSSIMFSGSTYSCNGLGSVSSLIFISSCCSDELACNYTEICIDNDPDSCQYPEPYYDCDDVCLVDSDGDFVCDELEFFGCTDPLAANYDMYATEEDQSCQYIVLGCTNLIAWNYSLEATDDDGSCVFCNDINADNYYADTGGTGTFCVLDEFNNYTLESGSDGLADCCFYPNPGCTDDGSCYDIDGDGDVDGDDCDDKFLYFDSATGITVYYESPFPDFAAANYNPNANSLIGVDYCYYFPACQDENALNYGYNCNGDNILAIAESLGFIIDFNEQPTVEDLIYNNQSFPIENSPNCCLYYGCDDPNADNFHDIDGVFYTNFPDEDNYLPTGEINFNMLYALDGVYSSYLTSEEDDPVIPQFPADLPDFFNVTSEFSPEDIDGDGILNSNDSDIDGDESIFPYPDNQGNGVSFYNYLDVVDPDDTNPCVYFGCTDETAFNYNLFANVNDGSCAYYACSDPLAINYNPLITEDNITFLDCADVDYFDNQIYINVPDGLDDCCDYLGCTDENAVNYDPLATIQELVFTEFVENGDLIYIPIPILDESGELTGEYEDTCYPYIYGCMDGGLTENGDGIIAENYNDYDGDGEYNDFLSEDVPVFVLDNLIMNDFFDDFAIDEFDNVAIFGLELDPLGNVITDLGGLLGANTNVNYESALDADGLPIQDPINSVNPCEYIYGCTDPCYVEYYDVVEYDDEQTFSFLDVNDLMINAQCDFLYNYGCTELLPPTADSIPTFDDGSCTNLLIYGCTDINAANYNPMATVNDCNSCIPSIEVDFSLINPVCSDNLFGSFSFEVLNGLPSYIYGLFSDSGESVVSYQPLEQNEELDFNLPVGDYFLEVMDAAGSSHIISFSIVIPNDFLIDLWESGGWLNTVEGYDSYEWTLDGDILLGDQYETYQIYPLSSGLYGVTANFEYDNGTCISNTIYYNYQIFESSIDNHDSFSITCIPNPFIGSAIINIDIDNSTSITLDLYDSFGKKIWEKQKNIHQKQSFTINNLQSGIYYLHITGLSMIKIMPIIVLK